MGVRVPEISFLIFSLSLCFGWMCGRKEKNSLFVYGWWVVLPKLIFFCYLFLYLTFSLFCSHIFSWNSELNVSSGVQALLCQQNTHSMKTQLEFFWKKSWSICLGKKLLCVDGIQKNVWFGKGEKIEYIHPSIHIRLVAFVLSDTNSYFTRMLLDKILSSNLIKRAILCSPASFWEKKCKANFMIVLFKIHFLKASDQIGFLL